jgi:hypothetical protein
VKQPETKELNPLTMPKDDEWVYIKGVVDSGAWESVASPNLCPHYEVKPSKGSLKGQNYVSASGDLIANLGEKVLDVQTYHGSDAQIRYQAADVSQPLNSVSEICDAGGEDGQYVIFSKWGGAILNFEEERMTPFQREEGIYTMGFWVKPKAAGAASGFPRQGK